MKTVTILKSHCRNIFLSGTGDFWYEQGAIGNEKTFIYKIYSIFILSLYGFMTILEILAAIIGDLPKDEKSDAITFAVSHTIVMIKISSVILNKELIKQLNEDMVRICAIHEEDKLMKEKQKIININAVGYVLAVYGSAAFFVFEGLRKVHAGSHFVTVPTYYPSHEDDSTLATSFRVFMTVVLMMMLMTMILCVDSFAMMYLIMLKYKIITLRHYFEGLRVEFDRIMESGEGKRAAERLANGLIEGIVMHGEVLRMSKDIHQAFGTVLTCQLCQSSGSAVSLLLQIALSNDLTFMAMMKLILFIIGLFFLLGLFLCNAGEITYQASLLSDSIFYCGWHACPPQHKVGRLVLFACAQAQRPLVMKSFKMLELTYATFLLMLRLTYSVFALFYAQDKNK